MLDEIDKAFLSGYVCGIIVGLSLSLLFMALFYMKILSFMFLKVTMGMV